MKIRGYCAIILAAAVLCGQAQAENITIKNTSNNRASLYLYPQGAGKQRIEFLPNAPQSVAVSKPLSWVQAYISAGRQSVYLSKGFITNKPVKSIDVGLRSINITYADGTVDNSAPTVAN